MIKTTDYFKMEEAQLLQTDKETGWTRESNKIYDEGVEVVWYQNEFEMKSDSPNLCKYLLDREYAIKNILETLEGKLAVLLH